MIYKDSCARNDHVEIPVQRFLKNADREPCINCNRFWVNHFGWNCYTNSMIGNFYKIDPAGRYLTKSMLDSMLVSVSKSNVSENTVSKVEKVPSNDEDADYKFFSQVRPGHCKCDIPIEKCKFHWINK